MKKIIIAILILLALVVIVYTVTRKENTNSVRAVFLDIGQGDASYVAFENGEDMLVDCSKDRRVLSALGRHMRFFDRTIDYLVVTHPDRDHYGGCVDVLKRFYVKHILYNGGKKEYDEYWQTFWQALQAEHAEYTEIAKEETWQIGSSTLHFLYPDRPEKEISGDVETNNKSIVFVLRFGNSSIVFTGDAEKELEEYLIQKYGNELEADILKVGHHGSPSSSEEPFLRMVSPQYATISVGKENTYGHPSLRVIRRLERVGAKVWRTDLDRDIFAVLNGSTVDIQVKK